MVDPELIRIIERLETLTWHFEQNGYSKSAYKLSNGFKLVIETDHRRDFRGFCHVEGVKVIVLAENGYVIFDRRYSLKGQKPRQNQQITSWSGLSRGRAPSMNSNSASWNQKTPKLAAAFLTNDRLVRGTICVRATS